MVDIVKRLLNVATLILIAFSLLVVITTVDEGFTRSHSLHNFGLVALGVVAIAAINHVAFDKLTLWHRANKK